MKKPKNSLLRVLFSTLNREVKKRKIKLENDKTSLPYNRRTFLSLSAQAFAGASISLSLPAAITSCRTNEKSAKPNILDLAILGAGIAGLNCANHLLSSSFNFKIFEASHRIGGRILTHYNDSLGIGIFPEFGGDFIDTSHTDMLALAKEFNLELLDLVEEQQTKKLEKDIYFFDNRKISEKEIIKEFKKISPKIAKDRESLGENYDTKEAIELDNTPLSSYINSLNCKPWLKELFVAAFIAEYGLDCEEQSTLNFLDLIDTNTAEGFKVFGESDERFRIKGGNSKIIEGLIKKIGEDKILLGHEVQEISENEDGTYTLLFKNGNRTDTRAIVCTIPFTILKKLKLNLKNITPEKRKCIDELGYGTNTKLVLGYEGSPWSNEKNGAMGYLFHKDIVNGWDSSYNKTENNTKGAYVGYFGGAYSVNLDKQSFKNKMAPPTHVWKTALPIETVDKIVTELDKVFKGSKDKFLGKHVFVNWIDFPFSKGSYSCYKVGQWSSISGKEIEPVGNFFFAGEHCSTEFQGFMNGAAETGKRVAEMVKEKVVVEALNKN